MPLCVGSFCLIGIPQFENLVSSDKDPIAIAYFLICFFMIMLTFILLSVYIRDVHENKSIVGNQKWFWIVGLFLGNALTMSACWYLYIWKRDVG